jgi:hypothetical protein
VDGNDCLVNIERKTRFTSILKLAASQQPKRKLTKKIGNQEKTLIGCILIITILFSGLIFYPRNNQENTPPDNNEPVTNSTITASPSSSSTPIGSTVRPPTTITTTITPTSNPQKPIDYRVITDANPINNATWKKVAEYAWSYFEPNNGINPDTGLPGSSNEFSAFTDWDLGVYIQAIMDAQSLNLISSDTDWSASMRIEKVMMFLETRELNATTHYPYWFYGSNGANYHQLSDKATESCNIADTGRLLVALNNLKAFNSSLANRIDGLVYNTYGNRSDYATFVPNLKAESKTSYNSYAYYIITGYASFWPTQLGDAPTKILNNIMTGPTVTTPQNVTLPNSRLLEDPLLSCIFELKNNSQQLISLARQAYLAHEAYYNATNGKYRAFGEGNTFSDDWAYEWVVFDNRTWVVNDGQKDLNIAPLVCTKIAFSFLAVYNTTFAKNIAIYIEANMADPTGGYSNGVDESKSLLSSTSVHTNGLIIGAAKYAIQNNP